MSDRQKLIWALLASAFFHLALGLVLALWTAQHSSDVARALPALSQLTVTIMPEREVAPAKVAPRIVAAPTPPPARLLRPVLDSQGLTHSSQAPAKPVFQSDTNMVAGSQLPASGDQPLPSQNGPRRKFQDFVDQAGSFVNGEAPVQTHPAQPAAAAQEQPRPATAAVQRPATPARTVQSTPAPTAKPAPTAAPDTLALGKPTATPLPTPIEQLARLTLSHPPAPQSEAVPMNRVAPARPATPSSSQPEPSMQRETEKTRIDGGIKTHGPAGVDAVDTPYGRYHHKLFNLIGSRWKLYLQEHPQDVGDVTILVELNTNGKVAATRVVNNHALDDLADISTRAIMESQLPPVPDDLAPMLRDGKLEISFSFSVYDPHNDDAPGR